MTTPISCTTATPLSSALGQTSTGQTKGAELDKDAFLKLLVAQLRYQDPSKPADATAFMAQTAQFTQVERLQDLSTLTTDLLAAQTMTSASALVGRTVSYTDATGKAATGVVTSAKFSGSTPTLRVGDTDVPLPSVTEVRTTGSSGTSG